MQFLDSRLRGNDNAGIYFLTQMLSFPRRRESRIKKAYCKVKVIDLIFMQPWTKIPWPVRYNKLRPWNLYRTVL